MFASEVVTAQSRRDAMWRRRATLIMQIFDEASRTFEKAQGKLLPTVRQVRTPYGFKRLFPRDENLGFLARPRNIPSRLKSRAECYTPPRRSTDAKIIYRLYLYRDFICLVCAFSAGRVWPVTTIPRKDAFVVYKRIPRENAISLYDSQHPS